MNYYFAKELPFPDDDGSRQQLATAYFTARERMRARYGKEFSLEKDPQGKYRNAILKETYQLLLDDHETNPHIFVDIAGRCKSKLDELEDAEEKAQNANFILIANQARQLRAYLCNLYLEQDISAKDFVAIHNCCDDITHFLRHFESTPQNYTAALELQKQVIKEANQLANKYMSLGNSNQGHIFDISGKVIFFVSVAIVTVSVVAVLSVYCPPVGILLGLGLAKSIGLQFGIVTAAAMLSVGFSALLKEGVSQSYKLFLSGSQKQLNKVRFAARDELKKLASEFTKLKDAPTQIVENPSVKPAEASHRSSKRFSQKVYPASSSAEESLAPKSSDYQGSSSANSNHGSFSQDSSIENQEANHDASTTALYSPSKSNVTLHTSGLSIILDGSDRKSSGQSITNSDSGLSQEKKRTRSKSLSDLSDSGVGSSESSTSVSPKKQQDSRTRAYSLNIEHRRSMKV